MKKNFERLFRQRFFRSFFFIKKRASKPEAHKKETSKTASGSKKRKIIMLGRGRMTWVDDE